MDRRTYLIEENVIKNVFNFKENHPIWKWFDLEGPIIRMVGNRIACGDGYIVTFQTQLGDITFDEEIVQEVPNE